MRELLQRVSSTELTYWIAYAALEPFGEERADLRNAMICTVTANSHSTKKFEVADFMPKFFVSDAELERRRIAQDLLRRAEERRRQREQQHDSQSPS